SRTTQLVFITGHLSTTTMSRPEARCHGPTAVSTGQVESRRFSIVTVSRFQRVSAAAGVTRTTVEARARAAAMKARMVVLGRFMGWFPFGGVPLSGRSASLCVNSRSEEHTSELQSRENIVCRLLLEKKKLHIKTI